MSCLARSCWLKSRGGDLCQHITSPTSPTRRKSGRNKNLWVFVKNATRGDAKCEILSSLLYKLPFPGSPNIGRTYVSVVAVAASRGLWLQTYSTTVLLWVTEPLQKKSRWITKAWLLWVSHGLPIEEKPTLLVQVIHDDDDATLSCDLCSLCFSFIDKYGEVRRLSSRLKFASTSAQNTTNLLCNALQRDVQVAWASAKQYCCLWADLRLQSAFSFVAESDGESSVWQLVLSVI